MSRVILLSDLNSFYAAVECLYNPKIRSLPVAVCGDVKLRHGIVIAANQVAKKSGVRAGEDTIGSAKQKCGELVIVEPRTKLYNQFSGWAREIYEEYADNIESYGKDESWLDISNLARDEYEGQSVADEIRAKIKKTLGITCSIGVSFNKTISKLASDLRKPDATTVISRVKFKEIVWPLSPDKLLGVDTKTNQLLCAAGITDIGNIAKTPVEVFEKALGKNGRTLHRYASGEEKSYVKHKDYVEEPKTVGHIHTTYRDMTTLEDIRHEIYSLSERAASEIREQHYKCRTVQVNIRTNDLKWCDRQGTLETPSYITNNIAERAMEIFMKQYKFTKPLRSIGVRVNNLVPDDTGIQGSFFDDAEQIQKMEKVAQTVDMLRSMYGYDIIQRGNILEDKKLTDIPDDYNRASYRVGSAFFKDA
ncbi:MAG: DNA polymerase IV [Oscillospiraceae bacterium]|nr:DNA polymerase IV [Oscillospiraceae bacterium]